MYSLAYSCEIWRVFKRKWSCLWRWASQAYSLSICLFIWSLCIVTLKLFITDVATKICFCKRVLICCWSLVILPIHSLKYSPSEVEIARNGFGYDDIKTNLWKYKKRSNFFKRKHLSFSVEQLKKLIYLFIFKINYWTRYNGKTVYTTFKFTANSLSSFKTVFIRLTVLYSAFPVSLNRCISLSKVLTCGYHLSGYRCK